MTLWIATWETTLQILFPHGAPADPRYPEKERRENDERCMLYADAFGVPVVYANSVGKLEYMPGMMGRMMKKHGFRMNGMSRIFTHEGNPVDTGIPEALGVDIPLSPKRRSGDILFLGDDILPGNWLFRRLILIPDTRRGIREYERNR